MKKALMILVVLAMAFAGCRKDPDNGGNGNPSGTVNGHEWVDLGLPSGTLWATCNLGANTPAGYGYHYAWGETQPQADNTYSWSTYKYANGAFDKLTKYCSNENYGDNGFTDNLTMLEAADDAATANWGSGWRTPTSAEFQELMDKCKVTWTTQDGINGRLFAGSNGNTIFLPVAGFSGNGSINVVGTYGCYWSSSLYTEDPDYAFYFYFNSGGCRMNDYSRYYGFSVRPVCSVSQK